MKQLILVVTIVSVMFTDLQSQWEVLNDGWPYGNFNSIDFVNNEIGWISAGNRLLKTTDGGLTWDAVPLNEGWSVERIDFINEFIGWGFGPYYDEIEETESEIIIKSEDGGHSWSIQKEFKDAGFGYWGEGRIQAIDDSIVFIIGYRIHKTINGGIDWLDISPNLEGRRLYSISFIDSETGIITGSYDDGPTTKGLILKTNDGGNSWQEIIIPEFTTIYNLQFINDSTANFLAKKEYEQGNIDYFLCATTDTLNNWTIKTQGEVGIYSFYSINQSKIFAIMEDTTSWYIPSNIMKSLDGGANWEVITTNYGNAYISSIFINKDDMGFALGIGAWGIGYDYPFILNSTDGGDNWSLQKFTYSILDIQFIDKNNGFAVCRGIGFHALLGLVLITDDGGVSWKVNSNISGVSSFFNNDQTGFILSDNHIYKTNDFGSRWKVVYENNFDENGYDLRGKDIFFTDDDLGWAVGKSSSVDRPIILGTSDGGENWDLAWEYQDSSVLEYSLNSIHAVNNTAWAVGEYGMIVKYTEHDQWQVQSSNTDLPLKDIFFNDENHGWIAGGYIQSRNKIHPLLLRTGDGGASWQEIPDFNYEINDMYFENNLHGWAVGEDTSFNYVILETFDGGTSWSIQLDHFEYPLYVIDFKDGFGWVTGEFGLILRTSDGNTWIDQKTGKAYPSKFNLSQNYPNPFNPKTSIEYQLPRTCLVDISIYNLLGQRVATLVNKKQTAGAYNVEWDASGFASGIYLYRIKTATYFETKKLVLLK
ncbi:MAG: T9SS C-terminal target domain-containing protein [Calditrichaeota bacterium]|nr:MAG: T9SS C-terminal target domain-containing protein [Calditrichota bacterium]MBL1206799.1 T9SS C-terminal target domain-containing protein [Calditrichota bacterium]NOG46627.1 T9SS type A sorting domain-containing protein [Calditrichota bacterium]